MCALACRPLLPPFAEVPVPGWVGEGKVPGKGWGDKETMSLGQCRGFFAWRSIWVQKQGWESRDAEH